jgi:hypothetical protein
MLTTITMTITTTMTTTATMTRTITTTTTTAKTKTTTTTTTMNSQRPNFVNITPTSGSIIIFVHGAIKMKLHHEGKSAASSCHQVSSWFPDMFCNFYLVKNHKIAKTSMTTKAREKSTDLDSLEF